MATLSDRERSRYARHLVLPSIGETGQERLRSARVLIVGLGGLGSPIALYLAAAGVGTLGLVDPDIVSFSNLQRQILHGEAELKMPKTESSQKRLTNLNPDVRLDLHPVAFDRHNGVDMAAAYDLIVDGTDSFETRYAINEVCLSVGIPYVYGAIFRLEGQLSLFCTKDGPCYRCLFPEPPPERSVLSGEEAGVLGAVPGTIGTLQATEAIKWIVGIEPSLAGRLLIYDACAMRFDEIAISRNEDCPACNRS